MDEPVATTIKAIDRDLREIRKATAPGPHGGQIRRPAGCRRGGRPKLTSSRVAAMLESARQEDEMRTRRCGL